MNLNQSKEITGYLQKDDSSGINIQEIASRLGHSKIEITWNTYSHLYPREQEKAVDVLNRIALEKAVHDFK